MNIMPEPITIFSTPDSLSRILNKRVPRTEFEPVSQPRKGCILDRTRLQGRFFYEHRLFPLYKSSSCFNATTQLFNNTTLSGFYIHDHLLLGYGFRRMTALVVGRKYGARYLD